jgi:hypothetical protein
VQVQNFEEFEGLGSGPELSLFEEVFLYLLLEIGEIRRIHEYGLFIIIKISK